MFAVNIFLFQLISPEVQRLKSEIARLKRENAVSLFSFLFARLKKENAVSLFSFLSARLMREKAVSLFSFLSASRLESSNQSLSLEFHKMLKGAK